MEHGEGVVIEIEVEATKQEVGVFEAFILLRCCPVGKIEVDMDKRVSRLRRILSRLRRILRSIRPKSFRP